MRDKQVEVNELLAAQAPFIIITFGQALAGCISLAGSLRVSYRLGAAVLYLETGRTTADATIC